MLDRGLIQLYTGDCHRTNYAPMGLGLRAAGQHLRVYLTCFMPFPLQGGAAAAAHFLKPYFVVNLPTFEGRADKDNLLHLEQKGVVKAFESARHAMLSGQYDVVVLHEIIPLINQGGFNAPKVYLNN